MLAKSGNRQALKGNEFGSEANPRTGAQQATGAQCSATDTTSVNLNSADINSANTDVPRTDVPRTDVPRTDVSARSDGSLLRRFRGGEEDAATELYTRYFQRLVKLAKANTSRDLTTRFDPEDVVQSVFRSFFRRAARGSYEVPEGGELWRLLLVLALNKIRGLGIHHRAQKRDVSNTVSSETYPDGLQDQFTTSAEPYRILELMIDDLLSKMPTTQRRIVELRIEGHTVKSIADQTRRSRRTVERVLQGFRGQLAELIDLES